jgi:hypothetical protein
MSGQVVHLDWLLGALFDGLASSCVGASMWAGFSNRPAGLKNRPTKKS